MSNLCAPALSRLRLILLCISAASGWNSVGGSAAVSGSVLQHILDTAIAAGTGARVDVPAGNYTFAPATSLRIVGAENLTVSAVPPATLLFACGDGVHIANSSFVSFINFTIDYPSPCFAQGKVTVAPPASSPRSRNYTGAPNETVTVTFDTEHFPSPEDILRLAGNGPVGDGGKIKITFWDPGTLRIIAHGNHLFNKLEKRNGEGDAGYNVKYEGPVSPPGVVQAGALFTMHPRLGVANGTGVAAGLTYMITNSSNIRTVDLTIHGGATESVVEGGGAGNNTYVRVKVVRRPRTPGSPPRLLAANADGFHSSCVRVGPKLIDSEFEFTGDDILNIHSRMSLVLQSLSEDAAYIIDTLGTSSPADYDPSTLMLQQTVVGDTIAFFELGSLVPVSVDNTITSLTWITDASILKEAAAALTEINKVPYTQHISHPFGTRVWKVEWKPSSADIPSSTSPRARLRSLPKFTLVDVPRLRNVGAVLQGNYFHDAYMRFGLFDSPGMVVVGNRFERGFPAYIGESGDGWLEGPPLTTDVTFANNSFADVYGLYPVVVNPGAARSTIAIENSNVCTDANGTAIPCVQSPDSPTRKVA